jgi:HEAT repeat protein
MSIDHRDASPRPRRAGEAAADIPRLGKVLLTSPFAERRAWAAQALASVGRLSAYAYLRRALWDNDETVRVNAVRAVGELAVSQCAGELASVYAWSGPRVRREVLRAAARMAGRADFSGLLFLAAGDTDRGVRAMAARVERGVGPQRSSAGGRGVQRRA